MPDIKQWLTAWAPLGVAQSSILEDLYRVLITCYRAPHRQYHNEQHLDECLSCFRDIRNQSQHPAEIELAIWFHDAIYNPRRKNNEELSADWARREALRCGVPHESADRIHALILATKHHSPPVTHDAQILVDVDLAILAAEPSRFDQYEKQVREEYSWIPGFVFRHKRRQLLKALLKRQSIYSTALFQQRYELRARENMLRSLSKS